MASKLFKAVVPGSIMLMGEHAVLRGRTGLASAINRHITLTLEPIETRDIHIHSNILGNFSTTIENLDPEPPFTFVLAAIQSYKTHFKTGFRINIDANFSDKVGLGSSAAVTVAMHCALRQWLAFSLEKHILFDVAKKTILHIQGRASGTDVAASIYGGIIAYRIDPHEIITLENAPPFFLLYAGYKTSTKEVIQKVDALVKTDPSFYEELFNVMESQTQKAIFAIQTRNWKTLGTLFNAQQQAFDTLQLTDHGLQRKLDSLNDCVTVLGAKISGSGLGDCVIGLGKAPKDAEDLIAVESIREGMTYASA